VQEGQEVTPCLMLQRYHEERWVAPVVHDIPFNSRPGFINATDQIFIIMWETWHSGQQCVLCLEFQTIPVRHKWQAMLDITWIYHLMRIKDEDV